MISGNKVKTLLLLVILLFVLVYNKNTSAAEDGCAISDGQKIINLIQLFKFLGGGWEPLS